MSYSNFTFNKLKEKYGIDVGNKNLFKSQKIENLQPSAFLSEALGDITIMPLNSEKAKSEILIYPIIRELKRNNSSISIFSGYAFNIKGQKDLNGVLDFLISAKAQTVELNSPIFCLVESKNKAADDGLAQCAAEMYASSLFNRQTNEPYEIIYGAVINTYDWFFLKLEGDPFTLIRNAII